MNRQYHTPAIGWLACPQCKGSLRPVGEHDRIDNWAPSASSVISSRRPESDYAGLLCEACEAAFPVIAGVPVLLLPEALTPQPIAVDTRSRPYDEAYAEMAPYSEKVRRESDEDSRSLRWLRESAYAADVGAMLEERATPTNSVQAERYAYHRLTPVAGTTALQIGGDGVHAIQFCLFGAARGILVTPVLAEAQSALQLAAALGVASRITAIMGLAEQLPLATSAVDRIYMPSTLHHTYVTDAAHEVTRISAVGAQFAAVDIWKAPFHGAGTRILGKANAGVYCHPMDTARLHELTQEMPDVDTLWFGGPLRYAVAAAERLGIPLGPSHFAGLASADEKLAQRFRGLRQFRSLLVTTAELR